MAKIYINRPAIKEAAKKALKGNYWTPIIALIVVWLVTGAVSAIGETIGSVLAVVAVFNKNVLLAQAIISLVVAILSLLVSSALGLGLCYLFIRLSRGMPSNVAHVFEYMKHMRKAAGLSLLLALKILLWSLLFVIPGIIAMYRYSMAPCIMADDPDISITDAINESKRLTEGNKWQLFVFDLSFIGWDMLAPLTCGILYFWLEPYMQVSKANFYNALIYADRARNTEASPEENIGETETPQ